MIASVLGKAISFPRRKPNHLNAVDADGWRNQNPNNVDYQDPPHAAKCKTQLLAGAGRSWHTPAKSAATR